MWDDKIKCWNWIGMRDNRNAPTKPSKLNPKISTLSLYTSFALNVIGTLDNATETGQPVLAASANP